MSLQNDCVKIRRIDYLSDLSEVNPEHDNLDVHVTLDDGREFTFVVATPNNVFWPRQQNLWVVSGSGSRPSV